MAAFLYLQYLWILTLLTLVALREAFAEPSVIGLLAGIVAAGTAPVFARGSWNCWREYRHGDGNLGWITLACALSVLLSMGAPLQYAVMYREYFWQAEAAFAIPQSIGILGVIAFRSRRTPHWPTPRAPWSSRGLLQP